MRVFVTGATGVLGRRLVEQLTDRGHDVIGLVRDDEGARLVESRGGTARRGDVLEPRTLEAAVDSVDIDAVIHAATKLPVTTNRTEDDWAQNDRVRLEGAKNLLEAVEDIDRFVFPSVVWLARQPDGSTFGESAPRNPDRATESAAEVEQLLERRGEREGFEPLVLRSGLFYAPDAGDLHLWANKLLDRRLPVIGRGLLGRRDAELSVVHVDDAARAFGMAIDRRATGIYHVVDDEPVTGWAFFSTFADLLDAPEPRRIPAWLARRFVGDVSVDFFTTPMPTTNDRIREDVGWNPKYPTYREGLEQVVDTWREDGTLAALQEGASHEELERSTGATPV